MSARDEGTAHVGDASESLAGCLDQMACDAMIPVKGRPPIWSAQAWMLKNYADQVRALEARARAAEQERDEERQAMSDHDQCVEDMHQMLVREDARAEAAEVALQQAVRLLSKAYDYVNGEFYSEHLAEEIHAFCEKHSLAPTSEAA